MKLQLKNPRVYETKIYRIRRKRAGKTYYNSCVQKSGILSRSFNTTFCKKYFTSQLSFLDKEGFVSTQFIKDKIVIPVDFTFTSNYDKVILVFKNLVSSYVLGKKEVLEISFDGCSKTDISSVTLLDILKGELETFLSRHNERSFKRVSRQIKVTSNPSNTKIQKYLYIFGWIDEVKNISATDEYLKMDLIQGKKKAKYNENPKGVASTKVVDFINKSLTSCSCILNEVGVSQINNFIGEVLNNAEDHSLDRSEWFVNGVSFLEDQNETNIVELNLVIINYGESMFLGFENTKSQNYDNYSKLEKIYTQHKNLKGFDKFEKESLFTMYMLNEGISRLKFKNESRGNGTMNFIRAFIAMGEFGKTNPNFMPRLTIVSGHTMVLCSIDQAPYRDNNFYKISLNTAKDLKLLPDPNSLKYFTSYFPGTILECKIFLNKDFLTSKIKHDTN